MKPEQPRHYTQIQGSKAKPMGSAPGLGKVSRLRDPDIHPASHQAGRRRTVPKANDTNNLQIHNLPTLIRSLGLVILTLLVIGGFIFVWLRSQMSHSAQQTQILPQDTPRIISKFVSPSETEALNLVKRALAIRDSGKVGDCFRPSIQTPEEVVKFLKNTEERDGRIDNLEWLRSMDVDDILIDGVLVYYTKNKERSERLAMLVPDDNGVWKLDFDSFARSCEPSLGDLLAGRVNEAEVRIIVIPDSYYNGPFLNDSSWVCFAMVSPDLKKLLPDDESLLHGYCKAQSPQTKAMERIFSEGTQMNRVIVKIQRVEGGSPRQFEITRVLSREWITPRKPFDEKF